MQELIKETSTFQDQFGFGNKAMDEVTNEDDADSLSDDHQQHHPGKCILQDIRV